MSYNHLVLLIQGEQTQFNELDAILEDAGWAIRRVKDSSDAVQHARSYKPMLILMDLVFGDKDAISLLKDFNSENLLQGSLTVVFSERRERYVEIAALDAGADDYVIKPVNSLIFSSKVKAWSRRLRIADNSVSNGYTISHMLDRERYSLVLPTGEVLLQRKEFEIVSLLASRPRKIFSRIEIKERVWGDNDKAKERTIDVHVTNLRSKIGIEVIKTHKGIGYSFEL